MDFMKRRQLRAEEISKLNINSSLFVVKHAEIREFKITGETKTLWEISEVLEDGNLRKSVFKLTKDELKTKGYSGEYYHTELTEDMKNQVENRKNRNELCSLLLAFTNKAKSSTGLLNSNEESILNILREMNQQNMQ